MSEQVEDRDPLEILAAEFVERLRSGQSPPISDYVASHPDLAAEIQELFPTIAAMERLKVHKEQSSGSHVSLGAVRLERLGDFRILGEIGRGGMGIVYEAFQESLGRHVAVKVLPRQSLLDPKHLRRFQREAQTAARLHHTNIVPVFGVGEHDGFHYIVMQLIRGTGLDAVLAKLQQVGHCGTAMQGEQDVSVPSPACKRESEVSRLARALVEGHFWQSHGFDVSPDSSANIEGQTDEEGAAGQPSCPEGPATKDVTGDDNTQTNGGLSAATELPTAVSARNEAWQFGPPYWRSIALVGQQVAEALYYSHTHHTLHGDIKPANLLLDPQGVTWITDFGLAKAMEQDNMTQAGALAGTLRIWRRNSFPVRWMPEATFTASA